MTELRFYLDQLATPIGELQLVADDQGCLRATFWTDKNGDLERFLNRHYAPVCVKLESAQIHTA